MADLIITTEEKYENNDLIEIFDIPNWDKLTTPQKRVAYDSIIQKIEKVQAMFGIMFEDMSQMLLNNVIQQLSLTMSSFSLQSLEGIYNYSRISDPINIFIEPKDNYWIKPADKEKDTYSDPNGNVHKNHTRYNEFVYMIGKNNSSDGSSDLGYPAGVNIWIQGPEAPSNDGDYRSLHVYKLINPVTINSANDFVTLDLTNDTTCSRSYEYNTTWQNNIYDLLSTSVPNKLVDVNHNNILTNVTIKFTKFAESGSLGGALLSNLEKVANQLFDTSDDQSYNLVFNSSGAIYQNKSNVVYYPYNNFIVNTIITDQKELDHVDEGSSLRFIYDTLSNGINSTINLFLNATGYSGTFSPLMVDCNFFPSNPIGPNNSTSTGLKLSLENTFVKGENFKYQTPQFIIDGFKFTDAPYALKNLTDHPHKGYHSGDWIVFNSAIFKTLPTQVVTNFTSWDDVNDYCNLPSPTLIANLLWEKNNKVELNDQTLTLFDAGNYFLPNGKTICLGNQGDTLLMVAYQNGNAYILGGYDFIGNIVEGASDNPDGKLSGDELGLIAVLYNVYEGHMSPHHNSSLHLNPDYSQIKFTGDTITGYSDIN